MRHKPYAEGERRLNIVKIAAPCQMGAVPNSSALPPEAQVIVELPGEVEPSLR